MQTRRYSALAAALGLLSCTAAVRAADLPVRTAPPIFTAPVVANGWGGLYAGATYGYSFTNFSTRQAGGGKRTDSGSGQIGGGVIGYNVQTGHFVYGAEGSIDLNVDRKNNVTGPGLTATNIDSMYDIRLRGRLGYEFGWFMPFVAGGAVINETYQSTVAPDNYFGRVNRTIGYTVGGGVDFKLNPAQLLGFNNGFASTFLGPLILRIEYLHDELPTSTYAFAGQSYRTRTDSNLVRAAIISRFGDNPPRPYTDAVGNVNWAGAYGGVFGGGGSLTPRTRQVGVGGTNHFDATGALGGIYTGTNFMVFNRVMLGIEGTTAFTDISGTGPEPTGRASFRNYVQADIRGRVGYAFGNVLPFVAGGVLYGRSEQIDQTTGSERGRVNSEALTIGGGLDYRVSERISLRGEYLYASSYNKKNVNLNGCNCTQELDGNIFRIGAAYHFE